MSVTTDLKLHLPLDEIHDGEARDTSGAGRNATVHGDPRIVADAKLRSCLRFDADDHLRVEDGDALNLRDASFTISAWIKAQGSWDQSGNMIFWMGQQATHEGLFLWISSNGQANFGFWSNNTAGRRVLPDSEWVHLACRYDKATGEQAIFIDGQADHAEQGHAPFMGRGAFDLGQMLDQYRFNGDIAHLRVYGRALSAAAIQQVMQADLSASAAFRESHPLDVALRDDDDNAVLFISGHPDGEKLNVDLLNTSPHGLAFASAAPNAQPDADNFHFELRFRPGTLAPAAFGTPRSKGQIRLSGPQGWSMSPPVVHPANGTVSLYFLHRGSGDGGRLTIPGGGVVSLLLRGISADPAGGARGTRVEFRYRDLYHAGSDNRLGGDDTVRSRIKHLSIVNHRGKAHLPLHVGFAGSNTILNMDGKPNALTLRITNVMRLDPAYPERSTLSLAGRGSTVPSEFLFSFDVEPDNATADQKKDWALGVLNQVSKIGFMHDDVPVPNIDTEGQSPLWQLILPADKDLAAGDHLQIELSGIVSSLPNGQANLYVHYRNVPGYWDGQLVCIVEKSPLVQRGKDVGVGVADPGGRLHVVSENQEARFGNTLILGSTSQSNLRLGYHQDYSWVQSWAGKPLAINPASNNVGIGTTNPEGYKLDVNGSVRADIFYDRNDTNFFVNPAGTSILNAVRADILYDRNNTSYYVNPAGTSILSSVRADIYYDRDDTSYYVNPAGVSNMKRVDVTNMNGHAILATSKNYPAVWVSATDANGINVTSTKYPTISATGKNSNCIKADNNSENYPCVWAKNAHPKGYDFYAAGNAHYGHASSVRLKRDIRPIADALGIIKKIAGVRFVWKESEVQDIGFVAEDAGKHIPEAVKYEENGKDAAGMSYDHVIPVLVEAVKEQDAIISELRERLDRLTEQITETSRAGA